MAGGTTNAELRQRVEQIEAVIGETFEIGELSSLLARMAQIEAEFAASKESSRREIEIIRKEKEDLLSEVLLLRRALNRTVLRNDDRTKIEIPKLKAYNGAKSAKYLENFLFDMEQYFEAARVPDIEKAKITTMYLCADAKVWWRTRVTEVENASLARIDSWDDLKKELKGQFLPTNSSWVARDGLRKLKQSGTTREYMKEFSS